MLKKCKKCNEIKNVEEFHKRKDSKDGYRNVCKDCRNKSKIKYRYNLKCLCCNKTFESENKYKKYCSEKCRYESLKGQMIGKNNPRYNSVLVLCKNCGKEFLKEKNKVNRNKNNFCNLKCYGAWKSKNSIGENNNFYGKNHSKETKELISKIRIERGVSKGNKNPAWNSILVQCSYCGKEKYIPNNEKQLYKNHFCNILCKSKWQLDTNITDEEREQRRSLQAVVDWRIAVYKRDNYTCQCCGVYGGKLNSHHLDGWNWCKEKRFDVNNGITLCEKCHREFHSQYGNGNNNKKQFDNWIKNKF